MADEDKKQEGKKDTKIHFRIAETVTADGPKRPKPTDSDMDTDSDSN